MANSTILKYFILVFITLNLFGGLFGLNDESFNINDHLPVTSIIRNLDSGWLQSAVKVLLVPFIIIDFLLLIIS